MCRESWAFVSTAHEGEEFILCDTKPIEAKKKDFLEVEFMVSINLAYQAKVSNIKLNHKIVYMNVRA